MTPILDPRDGDIEDDALSTRQRSIASLAGSLVVEISPLKLIVAWLLLVGFPAFLLGLAPRVAVIGLGALSSAADYALTGFWSAMTLVAIACLGWFFGARAVRLIETSFWTLNGIFVQPIYALCREGLRHAVERMLAPNADEGAQSKVRAICAALAGVVVFIAASLVIVAVWPATVWFASAPTTNSLWRVLSIAFANSAVLVAGYMAVASLAWGIADATMSQPRNLCVEPVEPSTATASRRWRIAHLSDIHLVSGRYGFRIESGRSGPKGNGRFHRLLVRLDEIRRVSPLDIILVTGDATDSGSSAEWAEFFDVLADYPELARLFLILPGNHDVNVVDRVNAAKLDLPTSPKKRLRNLRTLSAIERVQGSRVRVVDTAAKRVGQTLSDSLKPHIANLRAFSDTGSFRLSWVLGDIWAESFPMVLLPDPADGLGVILLNSNAETHFSFTNALGLISLQQVRSIRIAVAQYPRASWIIALHHHVVEYPGRVNAFSERIGTALVNGNWFVRTMQRIAPDSVLMHGHRHIDWIGACGPLRIISAPSPTMEATDEEASHFYIHTFAVGTTGSLDLLPPERVDLEGARSNDEATLRRPARI